MSSGFKPSYLSSVLRAGARPFAASAHAAPRKSAHSFPHSFNNAGAAAPPDAGDFETQHTDTRTPSLSHNPTLPHARLQNSAHTDDAPHAHASDGTHPEESRRAHALPTSLADERDDASRPRVHNARRADAPVARSHVENFSPRENELRASFTSDEAASHTTHVEQSSQEPQDEARRLSVEPPSVNSVEEATEISVAPRINSPEAKHAQTSEPPKTLEAHISELRSRMQAPRGERARATDAETAAAPSSSAHQPAPRSLPSSATHAAFESRRTDAQTTHTETHAETPSQVPTPPAAVARPRDLSREASITHAMQTTVRQANATHATTGQTPRQQSSTRPTNEPRTHEPRSHEPRTREGNAQEPHTQGQRMRAPRTQELSMREARAQEPRAREGEARRESSAHEERAARLSINRLDVRIVDETPKPVSPPPAPQPQANAPAHADGSDGWATLDRHYLGRFYLG